MKRGKGDCVRIFVTCSKRERERVIMEHERVMISVVNGHEKKIIIQLQKGYQYMCLAVMI